LPFEAIDVASPRFQLHHTFLSPTSLTAILENFLAQYPALQSFLETMKSYYITPKVILLFIFGLLVFIRGINADDKTPPSTLQIGAPNNKKLQC
jgi:hypothetical protein